jgi:hypothetical protein
MIRKFIFPLLFILQLSVLGQSTFSFKLEYPNRKVSVMAIDDGAGGIITPIIDYTGTDYGPGDYIRGYLLRIDSNGDTTTHHYSFHDTTFRIQRIFRLHEGGYMIFGGSIPPGQQQEQLLIAKLDSNFILQWSKHYPNDTISYACNIREVFRIGDTLILAGARCEYPCNHPYPYLLKIDLSGNIIQEVLHLNNDLGGRMSAYMYCPQTGQIWLFFENFVTGIAGPARCVFVPNLDLLYCEGFPTNFRPGRIKNSWTPDSTILMAYIENRPGAEYQDDEIWLTKFDTSLNVLYNTSFGSVDTMDQITMSGAGAHCLHPDTIYFAGFKHATFFKPTPGHQNWIIVGQVDGQLEPRFLQYIGGDAYYETNYVIALSDGGFLVEAGVFNHSTNVYDLLFLKLNNKGLVNIANGEFIDIKKAYISPNPAKEFLKIECMLKDAKASLLTLSGSHIGEYNLEQGVTTIPITELSKGMYLLAISLPDSGVIETHKFIKK